MYICQQLCSWICHGSYNETAQERLEMRFHFLLMFHFHGAIKLDGIVFAATNLRSLPLKVIVPFGFRNELADAGSQLYFKQL
jgi:hypothetical protein